MTFVIAEIIVYLLLAGLLGLLVGYLLWYRRIGRARAETNVMATALHQRVTHNEQLERAIDDLTAERAGHLEQLAALTKQAERSAAETEALRSEISRLAPLAEQAGELRRRNAELLAERDRLAAATADSVATAEIEARIAAATAPPPAYVGEEPVASLRSTPDDLKRIRGVGPNLEHLLNTNGIYTYRQLARLTAEDRDALDRQLSFEGRIERDDWIGQARRLHREVHGDDLGPVDTGS